jgi:hypothetical protein
MEGRINGWMDEGWDRGRRRGEKEKKEDSEGRGVNGDLQALSVDRFDRRGGRIGRVREVGKEGGTKRDVEGGIVKRWEARKECQVRHQ